jgi:Calx-beta domain
MATVTTTFRQGVNGYTGTVDTMLQQNSPSVNSGSATVLGIDQGTGSEVQGLLGFDNLFGTGPGQIPPGAIITSASLTLRTTSGSVQGGSLHRMLVDWNSASTWSSLGNGVQADGTEAVAAADLVTGAVVTGDRAYDVTTSLKAWAEAGATAEAMNAANQGWLFKAGGTDGWDYRSSEGSVKPLLSVTYTLSDTPPPPPPPGVTITQSGGSSAVTEGGAGDSFTVALTSAPTANVIITLAGGTADVNRTPTTLTFTPANWNVPQTVTLAAVNDTLVEGPETSNITLTSSSTDAGYNNLTIAPVQVAVTDNDSNTPPPPLPTVSIEAGSPNPQTESANAKVTFTLKLDQAATQDITIKYSTVDGTAKAGSDFVGLTDGAITFTAGQTSKTVEVQLLDDNVVENPESFTVHIESATNANVATATATGNIADNDSTSPPPTSPTVVKVHDTTQYKAGDASGYGSGDPSGLCYIPTLNALFMCDSEHDESPYSSNTNLWSIRTDGTQVQSFSMRSYTKEPTGVAFNPKNGYLYITDDDRDTVYWVSPTNPSVKIGQFSVSGFNITDAEDPEFDPVTGNMYLLDGISRKFFELTSTGQMVSSMNLPSVMTDAEALAYDPTHKVFYVASGASPNIYMMDRSGKLLDTITTLGSNSYLNPITGARPTIKGLEFAPSSDPNDNNTMSLYVADYGVDQKNDGRLFEINLGSSWLIA